VLVDRIDVARLDSIDAETRGLTRRGTDPRRPHHIPPAASARRGHQRRGAVYS